MINLKVYSRAMYMLRIMTFCPPPTAINLAFPFSGDLPSVLLSGQVFYCSNLNQPGVGEGRH